MRAIHLAFTNPISEERIDEYLDWYQTDHLPKMLEVDGFVKAAVYRASKARPATDDSLAKYQFVTLYEMETDDLPRSFALLAETARSGKFGVRERYPMGRESMSCAYELAGVPEPPAAAR